MSLAAGVTTAVIETDQPHPRGGSCRTPRRAAGDGGDLALARPCKQHLHQIAHHPHELDGPGHPLPEKQQDAVAVSGSGPAYLFFVVER